MSGNRGFTWSRIGAELNLKSRITCFRKPDSADVHDGHWQLFLSQVWGYRLRPPQPSSSWISCRLSSPNVSVADHRRTPLPFMSAARYPLGGCDRGMYARYVFRKLNGKSRRSKTTRDLRLYTATGNNIV